jgi:hypothetical protein
LILIASLNKKRGGGKTYESMGIFFLAEAYNKANGHKEKAA